MESRDDNLLEQLYETNYRRLFRLADRILGDRDLADDLVQDTFLTALLHQEKILEHPNPEAWLVKTLSNKLANELQKHYRSDVPYDDSLEPPGVEPDPGLLEILPAKLPKEDADLLIWKYQLGMGYREIANRLGISEEGCRCKVMRLRDKVRKMLNLTKKESKKRKKDETKIPSQENSEMRAEGRLPYGQPE